MRFQSKETYWGKNPSDQYQYQLELLSDLIPTQSEVLVVLISLPLNSQKRIEDAL